MMNLSFGEQVKIILGRKGMTIKELAKQVEEYTGKPMSRQNMTQRLGRDNFQEQDMRMIAKILGCNFTLEIKEVEMQDEAVTNTEIVEPLQKEEVATTTENELQLEQKPQSLTRDVTVGEIIDAFEELESAENLAANEEKSEAEEPVKESVDESAAKEKEILRKGISAYFMRRNKGTKPDKPVRDESAVQDGEILGDINPYTGKEYETNSVRMHPRRIGYVQVYDQEQHMWTEMTEWAFLGYQERKKRLLGKDYKAPIYLD